MAESQGMHRSGLSSSSMPRGFRAKNAGRGIVWTEVKCLTTLWALPSGFQPEAPTPAPRPPPRHLIPTPWASGSESKQTQAK